MVFVLSKTGKPLMPTKRYGAVRRWLKSGRARVVKVKPFTIQLLDREDGAVQPVVLTQDPGAKQVGMAAVRCDGKVLAVAEVNIRQDIQKNMLGRRQYRRNRRYRKIRHRKARFLNRKKSGLTPTTKNLLESHLKLIKFFKSILPVSNIIVELPKFDTQKMENPKISGAEYQNGPQRGFTSVRDYVLSRDSYTCQVCGDRADHVHHLIPRSKGGTDRPKNLISLCESCHSKVHAGKISLQILRSALKFTGRLNSIRKALVTDLEKEAKFVSGATTHKLREILHLSKGHINDAIAIAGFSNIDLKDAIVLKGRFVRVTNRKLHDANPRKNSYREPYNVNRYLINKKGVKFQKGDLVEYITKQELKIVGYINTLFSRGAVRIADAFGKELYSGASINKVRKLQSSLSLLFA